MSMILAMGTMPLPIHKFFLYSRVFEMRGTNCLNIPILVVPKNFMSNFSSHFTSPFPLVRCCVNVEYAIWKVPALSFANLFYFCCCLQEIFDLLWLHGQIIFICNSQLYIFSCIVEGEMDSLNSSPRKFPIHLDALDSYTIIIYFHTFTGLSDKLTK